MKTEPLRIFLLEEGDQFMYRGILRKVVEIKDGLMKYVANEHGNVFQTRFDIMSANSKERIELVKVSSDG